MSGMNLFSSGEGSRRYVLAEHVEDRLEGVQGPFHFWLVVLTRSCAEEGRWRELLVVTGDDDPLASDDGGDGVGWLDLARLVEDDEVEQPTSGQHLANHEGRRAAPRLGSCTVSGRKSGSPGLDQLGQLRHRGRMR